MARNRDRLPIEDYLAGAPVEPVKISSYGLPIER